MKPAPFRYRRPQSLDEALAALHDSPGAHVLAGGQSLVPLMNQRRLRPETLVDITRVPGLGEVTADDGRLPVGALVTQAAFELVPGLAARCPLAHDCLPFAGHLATRNRGTVGGSIACALKFRSPLRVAVAGMTVGGARLDRRPIRGRRSAAPSGTAPGVAHRSGRETAPS